MSGIDVEALLACIAGLARERRPLAPGLRASGLPGAEELARRLEAGATLPEAFGGAVPRPLADLLAGERPALEHAALLVAGDLRARRLARAALADAVVPALLGLAAAAGVGIWLAWRHPEITQLALAWGWMAIPGGLLAVLPLLGLWLPEARFPVLAGWAGHVRRAGRWERAALCARWRLPEADLAPLLGADLAGLGPVLAARDAEAHCRRLAEHHRAASVRALRRLAWICAAGIHLAAGGLVLAAAGGAVQAWVDCMVTTAW